jgi:hypothetical protein
MFLGMGRYHQDLKIAAPYCTCTLTKAMALLCDGAAVRKPGLHRLFNTFRVVEVGKSNYFRVPAQFFLDFWKFLFN